MKNTTEEHIPIRTSIRAPSNKKMKKKYVTHLVFILNKRT